jgi:hypothetical protein
MSTLDSQVAFLRRSHAATKAQATRRANRAAKYQAECDAVLRAAYVDSAVKAFGNFIYDHAPATEFAVGNADTRFTTDAVRTTTEGDKALADALLQSAEKLGIIRSAGPGTWEVLTEDEVYGNEFELAVRRLAA